MPRCAIAEVVEKQDTENGSKYYELKRTYDDHSTRCNKIMLLRRVYKTLADGTKNYTHNSVDVDEGDGRQRSYTISQFNTDYLLQKLPPNMVSLVEKKQKDKQAVSKSIEKWVSDRWEDEVDQRIDSVCMACIESYFEHYINPTLETTIARIVSKQLKNGAKGSKSNITQNGRHPLAKSSNYASQYRLPYSGKTLSRMSNNVFHSDEELELDKDEDEVINSNNFDYPRL